MKVVQAAEGMEVAANHVYIIPPGAYLSIANGALHLSAPLAPHGARLPFDFLLQSLAVSAGERAICVVLSGTGADGSIGLKAVKAAGGLVIAQDPEEADFDGMPRSAIATGDVNYVLPVEKIAAKLMSHKNRVDSPPPKKLISEIIALLKSRTLHDFALYKPGTLERRIARRMDMAGVTENDTARYLAMLQNNEDERNQLAEDLLINVTSFFRDPEVFEVLAATVIPELVKGAGDQPIRIWVAGCSTGEETYSLAMLFLEQVKAKKSAAKIQIFASDVDAKAVLTAREGLYPAKIQESVSAARLSRFFSKEGHGYRVLHQLRDCIVFAVQDLLADPPFSKLDMVSCRNLLIYLRPEAQAKIISIFNFALHEGGFLLLGAAETAGAPDGRFTAISKLARLYRKTNHGGADHLPFAPRRQRTGARRHGPPGGPQDGYRRNLPETGAGALRACVCPDQPPAGMSLHLRPDRTISARGPRLSHARPAGTHQPGLRTRLKIAIDDASTKKTRVSVPGGRTVRNGQTFRFNIDVQPVPGDSDKLLVSLHRSSEARTQARTQGRGDTGIG